MSEIDIVILKLLGWGVVIAVVVVFCSVQLVELWDKKSENKNQEDDQSQTLRN